MSAPVLLGYAESGDYTERKKDRTQNNVTPTPSEACAEQRQDGEAKQGCASRRSFPLPIRKGQRLGCPSKRASMALNRLIRPPAAGTAGHLSGSDRATRCPTEGEKRRGATLVGQGRLAMSTVGKKRLH